SPAEINLKKNDIVNMAVAELADAPVLLTGDIDRGGVFAAFVGTFELLTPAERQRILGFIINKFRGDPSLLDPAFQFIRQRTGKPVIGTVPWVKDLNLPDEDSVTFHTIQRTTLLSSRVDPINIAIIDLPHVSNFTDLDPLLAEPDTTIHHIDDPAQLSNNRYHLIIIPGSKNSIADLLYLQHSGIAQKLRQIAEHQQSHILGICGGMQILGETIEDPTGIESTTFQAQALALLPVTTQFIPEKTLCQVTGTHHSFKTPLHGYEIHHGQTDYSRVHIQATTTDGAPLIISHPTRPIIGTYLHGLFDSDAFRHAFLDHLRDHYRLSPGPIPDRPSFDIHRALDRLADILEDHLDITTILQRLKR
ncbi:MAG: cobyric acid synthase, partial [Lentisphaerae bacterium]